MKKKSKQLIVEGLYLDLEDLKQSKSDRRKEERKEKGGWGRGGGLKKSYSLHKEHIGCISSPRAAFLF